MKGTSQGKVFIIDDSPANLELLVEHLSHHQFEVFVAEDGTSALERLDRIEPDLVLLDVMMPGLNGFEVCRRLKESGAADLPVIFMTALDDTSSKVYGFEVGGVDYITKPFQLEEVLVRVKTHLALRRLQQHLVEKNSQLEQEIAERQRVEEMLRQRTAELETRNQELDAYAHTVAHDLKTPLQLLTGYSELLRDGYSHLPAAKVETYTEAIAQNGYKLATIVDQLLLFARMRNTPDVTPAPLDMARLVDNALGRLVMLIQECGAEIITPAGWPVALGHDPWIEEVWFNYLSNAIKYGGQPPRLELGADPPAGGDVRFWVRDNGPGLAPDQQGHLFTEFTALAGQRGGGHGLGLSIVRRIVERLGGQVGVQSQPDQGSTFYFTLPAAPG